MTWSDVADKLWLIETVITTDQKLGIFRAGLVLVAAFILAPVVRRSIARGMTGRWTPQQTMIAQRAVTYATWGFFAATGLKQLGFQLNFLLGAAGFGAAALTLASNTSIGNLISGVFLISEAAFVVGDTVQVSGITGEVLSIDLLSVKIRSSDNLFTRVPNEVVLKSTLTNISRFPIRRLDMEIGVGYSENISRVRTLLAEVAEHNPLGLEDPRPLFIFQGYGDSALKLQFSVWSKRENFVDLKNSMYTGVLESFRKNGVELPFPHRSLVWSEAQPPLKTLATRPSDPELAKT